VTRLWCIQVLAIIRLEMRKTFFSRRGLWVYLLAFAPLLLFTVHVAFAPRQRARLERIAREHPVSAEALQSIKPGMTPDQVREKLGKPYHGWRGNDPDERDENSGWIHLRYTDGKTDLHLVFQDGNLVQIRREDVGALPQISQIFAGVFQSYYLRLAVFFGCVGIFVNLFRGEMLDKSLHFYLLTPIRREVLLAGKYAAGLLATVVIFSTSTALQWLVLFWWPLDRAAAAGAAWGQFGSYVAVTALACVGYGSVFLAVGMLFRNPIIPTALVLAWEGVNPFLPAALKKISMIYYLQSLCPVSALPGEDAPALIRLLISPVQPATPVVAVLGILVLTVLVLVGASRLARRLEINYSTD
jgi:hypothetical protein